MIDVRELTKRFPTPGGGELTAVDAVSFSVHEGDVYGLLGSNGAGKTTTLRMILGLLKPTSGYATIDGFRSDEFPDEVKRRVGLVSANAGLYQYLSPREMLLFFADLYGVSVEAAHAELEYLAQLLGFTEFADRACSTLSTGQKQRVNLARALIHRPPVMLLDEPTLGLDVLGTQVITEFIHHVRGTGKAVILCTHHLDEAERICTRFGLMNRGQIVAEGDISALRNQTGCQSLVEMFVKLSVRGPALAGAAG
jgi:ABC-2 type transport system ATP-binding protein/sodium transport system ATP-binding protein